MAEKRSSTYKAKGSGHQEHCEAVPNQRLPSMKGSGNTRKEYDASQGERSEEFDATPRKPG
jgi:hypothetical protein